MAVTGPAPWSAEFSVAMTCGALGAPGQKGQYPGCPCRSTSSPTMTQERVIGSLRNSMLSLGKQRQGTTVNRGTRLEARHLRVVPFIGRYFYVKVSRFWQSWQSALLFAIRDNRFAARE